MLPKLLPHLDCLRSRQFLLAHITHMGGEILGMTVGVAQHTHVLTTEHVHRCADLGHARSNGLLILGIHIVHVDIEL